VKQCGVVETFDPETMNPIEMQRSGWQTISIIFKKYVRESLGTLGRLMLTPEQAKWIESLSDRQIIVVPYDPRSEEYSINQGQFRRFWGLR